MGVREQVAEAVAALGHPRLRGSVWAPAAKVAGVVWAQWAGSDTQQYGSGAVDSADDEWSVLCLLPDGLPEQLGTALDEWRPLLLAALSPIGRIGRQSAVTVALAATVTVPALQIQLYP